MQRGKKRQKTVHIWDAPTRKVHMGGTKRDHHVSVNFSNWLPQTIHTIRAFRKQPILIKVKNRAKAKWINNICRNMEVFGITCNPLLITLATIVLYISLYFYSV